MARTWVWKIAIIAPIADKGFEAVIFAFVPYSIGLLSAFVPHLQGTRPCILEYLNEVAAEVVCLVFSCEANKTGYVVRGVTSPPLVRCIAMSRRVKIAAATKDASH
jgi:hypothetical protein